MRPRPGTRPDRDRPRAPPQCRGKRLLTLSRARIPRNYLVELASGRVLSFRVSNTLDATFCTEALEEALRRYDAREIFSSVQGPQALPRGSPAC